MYIYIYSFDYIVHMYMCKHTARFISFILFAEVIPGHTPQNELNQLDITGRVMIGCHSQVWRCTWRRLKVQGMELSRMKGHPLGTRVERRRNQNLQWKGLAMFSLFPFQLLSQARFDPASVPGWPSFEERRSARMGGVPACSVPQIRRPSRMRSGAPWL